MFTRTTSRKPQPSPPSAAPGFAVQRFLQPKLTVGPVDDPFEREADRVAERVTSRLPAGSLLAAPVFPRAVQRQEAEEDQEKKEDEEEGEEVRLKAAGPPPASGPPNVSPAVEAGIRQAAGGGRPLPAPVRSAMESAIGADFRLVRVHADSRADHLNRSLGARAFTTGTDVFFRGGEFQPDSALGRRLIAHELTHVVQQSRAGAPTVPGTSRNRTIACQVAARIQRKVDEFKVTSSKHNPPLMDLFKQINYDYIKGKEKDIKDKIYYSLKEKEEEEKEVPESIEATISPHKKDDSLRRDTAASTRVGHFGGDEFFLRSGGTQEVFEGGHLIPHEVWTRGKYEAYADEYENLVPMSRAMNVGSGKSWKKIEKKILDSFKEGKTLKIKITVGHEPYSLSYKYLANLFGLELVNDKSGALAIKLYGWLPKLMTAHDVTTKKELGQAFESPLRDTTTPITTPEELVKALKQTPMWLRMSQEMQDLVTKSTEKRKEGELPPKKKKKLSPEEKK